MARAPLTETVLTWREVEENVARFRQGATVFVYLRGTAELATLFAGESGEDELDQPLITGKGGLIRSGEALAWLDPGTYDLDIDGQRIPWNAGGGGEVDTARLGRIDKGLDWSDGDLTSGGQLALNVSGHKLDLRDGSADDPMTLIQPTVKVSRVEDLKKADIAAITGSMASDGAAGVAAIHGSSAGAASTEVQTVGIFAGATNESNAEGENIDPDAAGIYGFGRILAGTAPRASAYGGVFGARRDVATAVISGIEVEALNFTETPEAYQVGGSYPGGKARGIWMIAGGTADSSVGLIMDNPFGQQFDVGVAFGGSKGGGKTGAIKSAAIRDDSHGKKSIFILGEHEEGALVVEKGAGGVLIGSSVSGFLKTEGTLLDVVAFAKANPLAVFRTGEEGLDAIVQVSDLTGNLRLFTTSTKDRFINGTAVHDSGLAYEASHAFLVGASGKKASLALGSEKLGFFGATPVAQSTGWSVTNVSSDKSFDADATTVNEVADVLGTLINFLKERGDLA